MLLAAPIHSPSRFPPTRRFSRRFRGGPPAQPRPRGGSPADAREHVEEQEALGAKERLRLRAQVPQGVAVGGEVHQRAVEPDRRDQPVPLPHQNGLVHPRARVEHCAAADALQPVGRDDQGQHEPVHRHRRAEARPEARKRDKKLPAIGSCREREADGRRRAHARAERGAPRQLAREIGAAQARPPLRVTAAVATAGAATRAHGKRTRPAQRRWRGADGRLESEASNRLQQSRQKKASEASVWHGRNGAGLLLANLEMCTLDGCAPCFTAILITDGCNCRILATPPCKHAPFWLPSSQCSHILRPMAAMAVSRPSARPHDGWHTAVAAIWPEDGCRKFDPVFSPPRHEPRWLHSRSASHHTLVLDGWRRYLSAIALEHLVRI